MSHKETHVLLNADKGCNDSQGRAYENVIQSILRLSFDTNDHLEPLLLGWILIIKVHWTFCAQCSTTSF
ncbi:hypothetical protein M5689_008693 [Euphorbia peplus]|nr:hypothetical protein M5689_008693 [Euphorbia peplus]